MRRVIVVVTVLVVVASVGWVGITEAQFDARSATAVPETTTTPTTTATGTPEACTESGQWLALSEINESEAMQTADDERVRYQNLSDAEQGVVRKAIRLDCAIHQRIFRFRDGSNPEVIVYEGDYYHVYVGVRTKTTTLTSSTTSPSTGTCGEDPSCTTTTTSVSHDSCADHPGCTTTTTTTAATPGFGPVAAAVGLVIGALILLTRRREAG